LEKLRKFKKYCYDLQNLFDNGLDDVKSDLLKSALWKLNIKDKEIASYQYNKPYEWVHLASKSGDLNNWRDTVTQVRTCFLQISTNYTQPIYSKSTLV